jgi:hypothetical protein
MKHKFNFFTSYAIMTFLTSVIILAYEVFDRLLNGYELNLYSGAWSILLYSLLFNILVIEYVRRAHALVFLETKFQWKNFWGIVREMEYQTINQIKARRCFRLFNILEIYSKDTKISIPLLFTDNDRVLNELKVLYGNPDELRSPGFERRK